jgi:hypothetical protein
MGRSNVAEPQGMKAGKPSGHGLLPNPILQKLGVMTRNPFWSGPTYGIIQAMKAAGNRPGVIAQWVTLAHQWALDHKGPDSDAIRAWLPLFQPRPFYTAGELAPMWPALIAGLGLSERPGTWSAGRLAHELDYGGLPCVKDADDGVWFRNPADRTKIERFYIVERIHVWQGMRLTQEEFEGAYYGAS